MSEICWYKVGEDGGTRTVTKVDEKAYGECVKAQNPGKDPDGHPLEEAVVTTVPIHFMSNKCDAKIGAVQNMETFLNHLPLGESKIAFVCTKPEMAPEFESLLSFRAGSNMQITAAGRVTPQTERDLGIKVATADHVGAPLKNDDMKTTGKGQQMS